MGLVNLLEHLGAFADADEQRTADARERIPQRDQAFVEEVQMAGVEGR